MKYFAILIALFSSGAWADDCTPLVEALTKQVNTSFRVVYSGTEWDKTGQCKSYAGLSRHNAGELSYSPYAQAAVAFPKISACRALGATTTITRADFRTRTTTRTAAEHFYVTIEPNAADKLISEFWISPETGLVLKRSETQPDKTTVTEYDYSNLDSIF